MSESRDNQTTKIKEKDPTGKKTDFTTYKQRKKERGIKQTNKQTKNLFLT